MGVEGLKNRRVSTAQGLDTRRARLGRRLFTRQRSVRLLQTVGVWQFSSLIVLLAKSFSKSDNCAMQNPTPPTPVTPLLEILRALDTDDKRDEFAALAGTSRIYLYQLAGCHRDSCRAALASQIAAASRAMAEKYQTPIITMEQLATMCSAGAVCAPR